MNNHRTLPIIAAFDFDGTLTRGDSLLPFLFFIAGPIKTYFNLALAIPSFLSFVLGFKTRQEVKERVLHLFFCGMSLKELKEKGEEFAQQGLERLLLSERMQRLRWHQSKGHRCILISASLDIYLQPWAKANGFDNLICSRLFVTEKGTVTGKLLGMNCWGPEKKRLLEELLGAKEEYSLYVYGDSRGDRELLAMADYPFFRHMPR